MICNLRMVIPCQIKDDTQVIVMLRIGISLVSHGLCELLPIEPIHLFILIYDANQFLTIGIQIRFLLFLLILKLKVGHFRCSFNRCFLFRSGMLFYHIPIIYQLFILIRFRLIYHFPFIIRHIPSSDNCLFYLLLWRFL